MRAAIGRGNLQAVFFDRDGTLIEHVPYLHDPAAVALLPGVRETVARLAEAAVRMFLFTNQSGVGRGLFTMADVEAVNRRMIDLLDVGDQPFSGICVAPELPETSTGYRKPSPRYIHEMLDLHGIDARTAWMVGDSPVDWEAGLAAGVCTAAIVNDRSGPHPTERCVEPSVPRFPDLPAWLEAALAIDSGART